MDAPQPDSSSLSGPRSIGAELYREWDLEARLRLFEHHRYCGQASVPALQLDDFSAIPFLDNISGVQEYQHRARLRAGDGDLVATLTEAPAGAEDYFSEALGLGRPRALVAPPSSSGPLAVAAACLAPAVVERLGEAATGAGGLVIHPFMGIAAVWDLAAAVQRHCGVGVEVLAPPPPITWIANDKARFEDLVRRVVGPHWLVESRRSREPRELAGRLLELAEGYPRVALKRLRCASAMGNLVLRSSALRAAGRSGVLSQVEEFLRRTCWDGQEEVLAVAWEETDLSPSTQWWIPPRGDGPPRLDGIYEQILQGEEKVFVGSRPSRLPEALHCRLADATLRVAAVLQELGYVGRCSFDHLVVGDPEDHPQLRFTECNGRWGGTSTPMHLVDRVVPGPRPLYRAQDFVTERLVGTSFAELLARVGGELYRADRGTGRFLFYNVGPLERCGKIDVVALAASHDEADWALEELLPELLGC